MTQKQFLIIFSFIIVLAGITRFYALDNKPMHHDEGNNWYHYIDKISQGKQFSWSAFNHGTTPFYLTSIPLFFLKSTLMNLRIMGALTGVLTIGLLIFLRKPLGDIGVLISAGLMTLSPSMLYYSRIFSMPYPYVWFFTLLALISVLKFIQDNKSGWVYLFAVSVALMITSHELVLIYFAISGSFLYLFYILNESFAKQLKEFRSKIKMRVIFFALIFFLLTVVLTMTQFFYTFSNLYKFFDLAYYSSRTVTETGHTKPLFYYFKTFAPLESFVFVAIVGAVLFPGIFLKRKIFSLFLFYWSIGTIILLSLLAYKIPWMFTIATLPFYLLCGMMVNNLLDHFAGFKKLKIVFILGITLIFSLTAYQGIRLNYLIPNGRIAANPLNYVGPVDDNYRMLKDMEKYLGKKQLSVFITFKDQYPLSYYLKDHRNTYMEGDNINLSAYKDYDVYIAGANNSYDDKKLIEIGKYELRENTFVKMLMKK